MNKTGQKVNSLPAGVIRLGILFVLWGYLFKTDLLRFVSRAVQSGDLAHLFVAPVMMLLIIFWRKKEFAAGMTRGSVWGVVLLGAGLFLYASVIWPFSYGYARDLAIIPVLAGTILTACGWRVLKLSIPILILLMLSIPIGSRLYATLIIRPETYTIASAAKILDLLPGVNTILNGTDIQFRSSGIDGVVALGESNRGAQLLMAYACIGVYVTFYRFRSWGRISFVAMAGVAIIMLCNLLRLLTWGLTAIYVSVEPVSDIPRITSAVVSLITAFLLFQAVCAVKFNLFVEETELELSEKVENDE